jgi:hypothetical protein
VTSPYSACAYEHLLAVGRLEEIRDREVREKALRMGLTVME